MASTYHELIISTESKFMGLISDFVTAMHDDALEISDTTITIRSEQDITHIQDAINELKQTLPEGFMLEATLQTKDNDDWISNYQNSVQPISAGRFHIHPSWEPTKEEMINITIDPALAFGSGHHGTTFACLEAISEYVQPDNTVLDIGCGSGILGLASVKLGGIVDLCDTDPISVQNTKDNFLLNNEKFHNIWQGSVNKTEQKYDIVIANIVADVLKAIKTPIVDALRNDGVLILSGILDKKLSMVTDSYKHLKLLEKKQIDEWVTLIYTNRI